MQENYVMSAAIFYDDELRIISTTGKSFWFAIVNQRREGHYAAWLVPIGESACDAARRLTDGSWHGYIPATGADFDETDFGALYSSPKAECFRDERVSPDLEDSDAK